MAKKSLSYQGKVLQFIHQPPLWRHVTDRTILSAPATQLMTPSPGQKAILFRAASATSTKASSSRGQTITSRRLSGSLRVCRWLFVRAEDQPLAPSVALCGGRFLPPLMALART